MSYPEILIIGAGATGLMAAHTLAKAGKKVTVLEARNRIGGRIHTLAYGASQHPAEMGAEFVHGHLPVTLGLLKEARIAYSPASASMWKYKDGQFTTGEQFMENWDLLMERLTALKKDITIEAFLQKEFAGDEYEGLRKSVRQFVSGYDNADPEKASTFALRREWQSEDEGAQHRVDRGYSTLINYFADELLKTGGNICLNAVVKNISWEPHRVKLTTDTGIIYEAKQCLIAMPLGVLQATAKDKGAVSFKPAIGQYKKAIKGLGFGAVIKILLEFDEAFWENKETEKLAGKSLKNMGYLFSEEEIPTWWTQVPKHTPLLTGWIGGPDATAKINLTDEIILQQGLQSIANIFKIDAATLQQKLLTWNVINWTADPLTRGSYAYDTINAAQARKLLCEPVDDTLFFAGEYLYEGTAIGTVEAALTSGLRAAKKILGK